MTANHAQSVLDDIDDLAVRVRALEGMLSLGAQAAVCTSATRPLPTLGRRIVESDTGLFADGLGTAWAYQPALIAQQTIGGAVAAVTFFNIPQRHTNLRLVITARSSGTTSSGYDSATMTFNGGVLYAWNTMWSTQNSGTINATGASSQSSMQVAEIWNMAQSSVAARGYADITIPNYSSPSGRKGLISTAAATAGSSGITQYYSGSSDQTGPVTSLTVSMNIGSFTNGTFSLYGL